MQRRSGRARPQRLQTVKEKHRGADQGVPYELHHAELIGRDGAAPTRYVTITRGSTSDKLGLKLEIPKAAKQLRIEEVLQGFAADDTKAIFAGDLVLSVDGASTAGLSRDATLGLLGAAGPTLVLELQAELIGRREDEPPVLRARGFRPARPLDPSPLERGASWEGEKERLLDAAQAQLDEKKRAKRCPMGDILCLVFFFVFLPFGVVRPGMKLFAQTQQLRIARFKTEPFRPYRAQGWADGELLKWSIREDAVDNVEQGVGQNLRKQPYSRKQRVKYSAAERAAGRAGTP